MKDIVHLTREGALLAFLQRLALFDLLGKDTLSMLLNRHTFLGMQVRALRHVAFLKLLPQLVKSMGGCVERKNRGVTSRHVHNAHCNANSIACDSTVMKVAVTDTVRYSEDGGKGEQSA